MGVRRKSSLKSKTHKAPEGDELLITAIAKNPPKKKARPARLSCADPELNDFLSAMRPITPLDDTKQTRLAAAARVDEAKERLGSLESEVIAALFPDSGFPESFESIASRLGMTPKEVREVADNALRGLRGVKCSPPRISSAWN